MAASILASMASRSWASVVGHLMTEAGVEVAFEAEVEVEVEFEGEVEFEFEGEGEVESEVVSTRSTSGISVVVEASACEKKNSLDKNILKIYSRILKLFFSFNF